MSWLIGIFWRFIYPIGTSIIYQLIDFLPVKNNIVRWKIARSSSQTSSPRKPRENKVTLFVCPSLGEYESVKGLIRLMKGGNPDLFVEIAFFSLSGYSPLLSSISHQANRITLMPADTKKEVQKFFSQRRINQVIISSLAIWPLFISHLIEQYIPYCFVGARIKSGRIKLIYYKMMSKFIKNAHHVFIIDKNSKALLSKYISASNLHVTGDSRIQSITSLDSNKTGLERLEAFKSEEKVIVFGSIDSLDEKVLFPLVSNLIDHDWKILIAPHDVDRSSEIKEVFPQADLWSNYDTLFKSDILIIDKIGILKYCYCISEVSYIGGGFRKSLHNIMEPLAYENLVIVGPQLDQSLDALRLYDLEAICVIKRPEEFLETVYKFQENGMPKKMKETISTYLMSKPNATQTIFDHLFTVKHSDVT